MSGLPEDLVSLRISRFYFNSYTDNPRSRYLQALRRESSSRAQVRLISKELRTGPTPLKEDRTKPHESLTVSVCVVHCKKEEFDIYIGRPSKWGNPFSHQIGTLAKFKVNSRKEAIDRYEEWIKRQPELISSLHELKNKVLGCWCSPKPCHGDVLIKLINECRRVPRRPVTARKRRLPDNP